MTKVKAQDVAAVLIGLGYAVTVKRFSDNSFGIRIDGTEVAAATVSTFAADNGILATVSNVELT